MGGTVLYVGYDIQWGIFSLLFSCKFVLEVFKVGLDFVQQTLPAGFSNSTLFLLVAISRPLS